MNKFFRVPEGRFTTADIMRLMMPLIIEQFLVVLVGMADTAMVAGVGEEAISGVSLVDAINILLLQVFMALTAGGGVVIAQYIGKKDINKACDGAKQIIYLGFFIAAAVMSICLLFDGAILGFMFGSVDSKIMESARIYFVYSAISYPFISVYYGCATIFRVKGNGRTPLAGSVMMNVINIVLNAVLIFGYHMGVAGAAIATLISRVASSLFLLALICMEKHGVCIDKIYKYKPDFGMIKRMLKTGLPNSVEAGVFQLGRLILQKFISTLGTASIAAYAVAMSIASFSHAGGSAVGTGMLTIVGQCMGAGEKEESVSYSKYMVKLAYVVSIVVNVLLVVFNEPILRAFNLGGETAQLTRTLLYMFYICEVTIWPLSFALPNVFKASGDNKFTLIIALLSMWICRILLGYILGKYAGMGIMGVWIAMFADWVVRSVIFVWRFAQREKWQSKRVI